MPSRPPSRLRRYWPAGVTLLLGLAASGGLGWRLHREAVELDQKRFDMRIKETVSQIEGRLEKTEALLLQLQDYLMLSGETRGRVFEQWCRVNGLVVNCPWVYGIAVATNRHAVQWRQELPNPPETWTAADWTKLRKLALEHPVECDLALKSSTGGKQFLADYDLTGLLTDSNRLTAAVRGWGPRMSGPRAVMMDTNGQALKGALFLVPVYNSDVNNLMARLGPTGWVNGEAARWVHLSSMILAPIDFKALENAVWYKSNRDLGVEIFASGNPAEKTWVNPDGQNLRALDFHFNPHFKANVRLPMYGTSWSLFIYTLPLFEGQSPRKTAWLAFGAGTGMSLLTTALLSVAIRARTRQEQLTDQIREARDSLAAAQQERQKLSHDLHDNTIQTLYAVQLGLGVTAQKLEAEPAHAHRQLASVRAELDGVIAEVRRFITADEGTEIKADLSAVLNALVQRAAVGAQAKIELHCDPGAGDCLAGDHAVQLANIAREALSNSLRHAKSQRVEITLRSEREGVVLEIADDGTGFDPEQLGHAGVGLASMKARTLGMGGDFQIPSAPGKGTRVVVRVPTSPAAASESQ